MNALGGDEGNPAYLLNILNIGNGKLPMPHRWSKEDDIVAYYLYRFGSVSLMTTVENISIILDVSEPSLVMRTANFRAIDGAGGLPNYAKLSKKVYDEYKAVTKDIHLKTVKAILG